MSESSLEHPQPSDINNNLDPADWPSFRAQAHAMLDDILDYQEKIRQRPVWQPIPEEVRAGFHQALPREAMDLSAVHASFMQNILPYAVGNAHPGFMGWVHGGGTPVGMLAEMLAAGVNANLGGRNQIPVEVERQITRWMQSLFGFPTGASGLFVTGTSMANLIAVLVARTHTLGLEVRTQGLAVTEQRLVAYMSAGAHSCIAKAMEAAGIGSDALRLIPMDANFHMDTVALENAITADIQAGLRPFMVIGTAGSVNVGAIDPLAELAQIAHRFDLWFHIDGAFGALGMLSPSIAQKLAGIELADSIAFDFHKWLQVPYDAGFILVRDGELHLNTFALPAAYLSRESHGIAAGSPWPCDYGPDLSRSFRALKTWFTFKVYGTQRLAQMIDRTCGLARYLAERIDATPELERLAPVTLNIVCFRYRCQNADRVNAEIAVSLQESGIVAPSTTMIHEQLALRAAIVNHRTCESDIDALIEATLAFGRAACS